MNNRRTITKPFFLAIAFFIVLMTSSLAQSQTLYEDFNYTAGDNVGGSCASGTCSNNNWTTHSVSNAGIDTIVSGSLSYAGLLPSSGNRVNIPGNNSTTTRDINRAAGLPANQATIYYSFLLNVIDSTQLSASATFFTSASNGYFIHFTTTSGASAGSFYGRVAARSVNSGTNYRLGIGDFGNTFTEVPTDLAFGTTYLVVVKYFSNPGGNDVATIWVNPSSLGGAEPSGGTSNSASAGSLGAFSSSTAGIAIRNSSNTPKADIDEIRVGTTYASVTPQVITAASATVGGRVTEANGRGIFRARVTLIDSEGVERYVYTNPQGYYSFADVPGGQTYIFTVRHLRYQFAVSSFVEFIDEDNPNINFASAGESLRPANRFFDQ